MNQKKKGEIFSSFLIWYLGDNADEFTMNPEYLTEITLGIGRSRSGKELVDKPHTNTCSEERKKEERKQSFTLLNSVLVKLLCTE